MIPTPDDAECGASVEGDLRIGLVVFPSLPLFASSIPSTRSLFTAAFSRGVNTSNDTDTSRSNRAVNRPPHTPITK